MAMHTRFGATAGTLGSVIAAASCPACLPALANLGAAAGLGVLGAYEGLLFGWLLPLFAAVALVANGLAWRNHRQWGRGALGMAGPALVLVALVFFMGQPWGSWLLYAGLAAMVAVSAWDLLAPARSCADGECGTSGAAS